MNDSRKTVVIAGARGFVGQELIELLKDEYRIIGLSRRELEDEEHVEWRRCDLFSRRDTLEALEGADFGIYLVHSMLPSARLTQGNFQDMDLICADNFARASSANGLEHVVYLGGIFPESDKISRHLASRYEVERTLGAYGVPITSLRAGLVVGPNGSSTAIVIRLVEKLPVMVCPAWTRTETQPVALHDVVRLIAFALGNTKCMGNTYDVGGPEIMTYKEMMRATADLMGVKRWMLDAPVVSPRLSTAWVSAFTDAPYDLVSPLVESLEHRMVAADNRLIEMSGIELTPYKQSMREAIEHEAAKKSNPVAFDKKGSRKREESAVRSVQRLPMPDGANAWWVADEYARWLPNFMSPFLRVEVDEDRKTRFCVRGFKTPLLELTFAKVSRSDRQLYWITGGFLAERHDRGRLEFREVLGGSAILAAIHEFHPRLPWYVYRYTQAITHLFVMAGYRRHLARMDAIEGLAPTSEPILETVPGLDHDSEVDIHPSDSHDAIPTPQIS